MSYYYACANEGLDCLQFEVIVLAGWGGAGLLSNLSKGRDANFSRVPLGKGMRQFEYARTGNDSEGSTISSAQICKLEALPSPQPTSHTERIHARLGGKAALLKPLSGDNHRAQCVGPGSHRTTAVAPVPLNPATSAG